MNKRELNQQCVQILRPEDQFKVVQNGQEKLMLVSAFTAALQELMAGIASDMVASTAVGAHTHPESDIVNLATDLNAIVSALANKAPSNHVHKTYVDATSFPAVVYSGTFDVTRKGTVASGNLVVHFTDDGLATGNALFPTGPIPNSELFRAEEGVNPHAFGVAVWSNGNKTLTVPVQRTGSTLTVLGLTVLGANVAANGSVVYATATGL